MGHRVSAKQGVTIRRLRMKDGTTYSIRPSFLMPYMTARTADVEGPLFLRKFGVPFWEQKRGRSSNQYLAASPFRFPSSAGLPKVDAV